MPLTLAAWLAVLAAASGLMVAALAARGFSRIPSLPVALLGVNLFSWNAATVGAEITGSDNYRWLGHVAAPLFMPLVLHFTLAWVGRARSLRWLLNGIYVLAAIKSSLTLADFLTGEQVIGGLPVHRKLMLLFVYPPGILALILAVRHAREAGSAAERYQGRVLISSILVLTLLTTDWLRQLGLPIPDLAKFGALAYSLAITELLRASESRAGRQKLAFGQAVLVSLFVVAAYLVVFINYAQRQGVLVIAISAVTLALLALLRITLGQIAREREQLRTEATLGRAAQQMAHDLKNPIAAARGGAQLLIEKLKSGTTPELVRDVERIIESVDRVTEVIDDYRRRAKFELSKSVVDLVALVRQVAASQESAAPPGVTITADLGAGPMPMSIDQVLIQGVIENLVVNAYEAKARHVSLQVTREPQTAVLTVQDDGQGMDARTLELVGEMFNTTKPQGSGLGLSFAFRVLGAHGGKVRVGSKRGTGTKVELLFPLEGESK